MNDGMLSLMYGNLVLALVGYCGLLLTRDQGALGLESVPVGHGFAFRLPVEPVLSCPDCCRILGGEEL